MLVPFLLLLLLLLMLLLLLRLSPLFLLLQVRMPQNKTGTDEITCLPCANHVGFTENKIKIRANMQMCTAWQPHTHAEASMQTYAYR